jgi:hypothetical protein
MNARRNLRTWLLSAGLVLIALLGIQRLIQRIPFDRLHFDRLQPGMTGTEAEQILDGAARNELREPVTVWLPREDSTSSYVLRPQAPAPSFFPHAAEESEQRLWVGREGLIAVLFDKDGRLVEKYYSDVHVPSRPGAMDTARHMLGL